MPRTALGGFQKLEGKHAVVMAGAGFLGSHISTWLVSSGVQVTCLDNLITGNAANVARLIELAEAIEDVVGNHPGIDFKPLTRDDPTVRRPDTTKAEEILGWKAQISLREGLERTLPWFEEVIGT